MNIDSRRNAWLPWAAVGLLAVLCGVLAVLQYRWLGEVSGAERQDLQAALRDRLDNVGRDLNEQISRAERGLQPTGVAVEDLGREDAYSGQYRRWKEKHGPLFRRIALAVPEGDRLTLFTLDQETGRFTAGAWPAEWREMQSRLTQRLRGGPVGPAGGDSEPVLLEMPRFGAAPGDREQEWMILEVDADYARQTLLPELLTRHLGREYDAEVVANRDPSHVVYRTGGEAIGDTADASVFLLDGRFPNPPGGMGGRARFGGGLLRAGPDRVRFGQGPPGGFAVSGPPPGLPGPASGIWLLRVRHKAGSLEALVTQARRRNLAVSGGLLLLILATVLMLMQLSRRAQQLAELQINFVAGVSHELRTPLTVIRTAAYNLRGRLAHRPEQVEQYGELIQGESERLGGLVEQILQFASAKAGHVIRRREAVDLDAVIQKSLVSGKTAAGEVAVLFEKHVEPGLPRVFADEDALQQAIQNLVDNAVKHGGGGAAWVGVFASRVEDGVQISVSDHGPGIPPDEQRRIFEPFYRGRRAVADQVHGTGLGLDLVKRIVEAHGGTIRVDSEPGTGASFVMRLPAMAPERQDALASPVS